MNARYFFLLSFVSFGIICNHTSGKRIPTFAGPYKIIIRTIGNESEEYKPTGKVWARLYFTPPRPKEIQYTWGYFYASKPVHDDMKLEVRVSQRSNNQWKRNAFVFKFDRACTSLQFHARSIVNLLLEPNERKCPTPIIGLRTIKNQTFDAVFPHFPVLPYARYLFTMAVMDGDEVIGIAVADGNAIPKL